LFQTEIRSTFVRCCANRFQLFRRGDPRRIAMEKYQRLSIFDYSEEETMKPLQTRLSILFAAALVVPALAAPGPGVIKPWEDNGVAIDTNRPMSGTSSASATGGVGLLTAGANHVISQQCVDNGWGWPHASCSATYNNITAPIAMGLLDAYSFTGDATHLAAAVAAGNFDLTAQYTTGETRLGAMTAYFMVQLSAVSGDPTYSNFAATSFFAALDAGTYGPTPVNTAGWIASVQAARTGTWNNLRPWEFSTIASTATAIGVAGQDALFTQAILDGLNTLDNSQPFVVYSDIIGLAGGVRGLALTGTTTFPPIVSPLHPLINGIDNLKDLADVLAGLQTSNGAWYWHSNLPGPTAGDTDAQSTAYAVMALVAADPLVSSDYSRNTWKGAMWSEGVRLADGGFASWPGGTSNVEVEGEILSAFAAAGAPTVPSVSTWGLIALTLAGMILGTRMFIRARTTQSA
jgi:hypothetical protein